MTRSPHLLAFGGAHIDRRGYVSGAYMPAASNPGTLREEVGGGTFNALRWAVRRGLAASLCSMRGGDDAGDRVARATDAAGIRDLSAVFLDRATPSYTALIDADGELIAGLADMGLYDLAFPKQMRRSKLREAAAGADALWVHARKAWLEGLSPKENREIPPLDYDRVYRLKEENPGRFIGINGGIQTLPEVQGHLQRLDGAMLGRVAYHTPGILTGIDAAIHGDPGETFDYAALIETMAAYAARHIEQGGRLGHITRHMVGLFHGLPGARRWRQILSTDGTKPNAGPEVLRAAFASVDLDSEQSEAA